MDSSASHEKVVVTGTGLVTAVGHDSIMGPAAIRARIGRFGEIPDFATTKGAKAVGSLVVGVTDGRSGSDRLLSMAIPALQEALFMAEEFYEDLDMEHGKLFLSLSAEEKPMYEAFDQEDLGILLEEAQAEGVKSVTFIRDGHAGGIAAVASAIASLREGKARFCIVGGVDSLVEGPALNWFEESGRLKTDDRPHGFIPGEAAAFIVLELESAARKRGAPIQCCILNTASTREEATIFSGKPLFGKGLGQSIGKVLDGQGRQLQAIDGILCDLNGEHYRTKEWALAVSRIADGSIPIAELWHPAECYGDIGAASGVALAVVASAAIRKSYFGGPNILVWNSSDAGARASMVITSLDEVSRT